MDLATAAKLCQRREAEVRETVSELEQLGYIEHGGAGRGTYWSIQPNLYNRLADDEQAESRKRIDWEAAKTRVLSVLSVCDQPTLAHHFYQSVELTNPFDAEDLIVVDKVKGASEFKRLNNADCEEWLEDYS